MFETPHYVSEVYQKKDDLRILRENVLLVVRDYNRYGANNIHVFTSLLSTEVYNILDSVPIFRKESL